MNYPTLSPGARLAAVKLKNANREEIGKIVEWMIDVEQGRIIYVLAELNASSEYYPLPWDLLKTDLEKGGYLLDDRKIDLNFSLPPDKLNDLVNDKGLLDKVFDTYKIPKYWQEAKKDPLQEPFNAFSQEREDMQKDPLPENVKKEPNQDLAD